MPEKPTHAGAVAFRRRGDDLRFLVVSSSDGRNWVLPKGHIEPGEAPEDAADRELAEEAGVRGDVIAPLTVQEYAKAGEPVRVQYFLIREIAPAAPAREGRALRWVDADEALRLVSFADAREALRLAIEAVSKGD